MRVSREDCILVLSSELDQGALENGDPVPDFINLMPEVKSHVESNLVVSAASSVQLCPDRPDPQRQGGFDIHVDVFQFDAKREAPVIDFFFDVLKSGLDLPPFLRCEQSGFFQGRGMSDRPLDIKLVQSPIERD
jgi:hypothetical protein